MHHRILLGTRNRTVERLTKNDAPVRVKPQHLGTAIVLSVNISVIDDDELGPIRIPEHSAYRKVQRWVTGQGSAPICAKRLLAMNGRLACDFERYRTREHSAFGKERQHTLNIARVPMGSPLLCKYPGFI